MKVVILCGGKGTRMGNESGGMPKPLMQVGQQPIIWHIMKYYAYFGFNEFLLCLGFNGEKIIRYLSKYKEFNIKFIDTGLKTNTGGRIKKIQKYIDSDIFLATYGDGLSNVNLRQLLKFHNRHKRVATLTAVKPRSDFGIVGIDGHIGLVTHFEEKPFLDHWINGGFFVFNKDIFKHLKANDILEKDTFNRLVREHQLAAYKHRGFWECMDTYKDNLRLNELWTKGNAPWALRERKIRWIDSGEESVY